ncbi:hypothetical protein SEVIR_5G113401v4 [Setaria viridis]
MVDGGESADKRCSPSAWQLASSYMASRGTTISVSSGFTSITASGAFQGSRPSRFRLPAEPGGRGGGWQPRDPACGRSRSEPRPPPSSSAGEVDALALYLYVLLVEVLLEGD